MPFIVATYVYACSPRAAHALRSDQFVLLNIKPTCAEGANLKEFTPTDPLLHIMKVKRKCNSQLLYSL